MFGHQDDQQFQEHEDNQAIAQSIDGVLAAEPAAHDDFNPALPAPGTDFGAHGPTATLVAPTAPIAPAANYQVVASIDEPAAADPIADDDFARH